MKNPIYSDAPSVIQTCIPSVWEVKTVQQQISYDYKHLSKISNPFNHLNCLLQYPIYQPIYQTHLRNFMKVLLLPFIQFCYCSKNEDTTKQQINLSLQFCFPNKFKTSPSLHILCRMESVGCLFGGWGL
jgi:hypothetical protein